MNWKSAGFEVFREALLAAGVHELLNWAHTKLGGTKAASAALVESVTEKDRAELFEFVTNIADETEREILMRRLRKLSDNPTLNEKFTNVLARIFREVSDDAKKRKEFEALARLSDEEFK